ncbi:MAG TPA: dinitrogenase iron-molybdenum cofactor biosynthesis protein [Cyanobacteria bacterium UBA8530]|nr:dinitrogenase iron-molybdenum cofactor biosynthesis protein [Cyanobacteria bacterium UBA8530]
MKIAFPAQEARPEALLDPRFGRAACFLLYDDEQKSWQTIDNQQNLQAAQGAGIQAAETIARHGANVLIAGHCGPKAFRTLLAASIKVYNFEGTVQDGLKAFQANELKPSEGADVEGHW